MVCTILKLNLRIVYTEAMDGRLEARSRLYEVAESQAGYFTSAQAGKIGYSYAAQHHHVKAGNWERVGHGIYRLDRFPLVPGAEYAPLMLWSRDRTGNIQAVVSHESALQAYELSDVMPAKVHLTVPKGFRKRVPAGVQVSYAHLPAGHVTERDGYRITTPLRTLLDVATVGISPELLASAVRDATRKGLVMRSELLEAIDDAPAEVAERFAFIGVS